MSTTEPATSGGAAPESVPDGPSYLSHKQILAILSGLLVRFRIGGARGARIADIVLLEFGDEARRLALQPVARAFALPAMGDGKRQLRTGDADVHQPALFVDLSVLDALAMRQQSLFDADQEHVRKLQAFSGMQRRQAHRIGILSLFIEH